MYKALIEQLRTLDIPLAEGAWNNAPQTGNYAVIALYGEGDTLWADDCQLQQALSGTIDLYCRDNARTDFEKIQRLLKGSGISWRLNSIQHETRARLVHYEWTFELETLEDIG